MPLPIGSGETHTFGGGRLNRRRPKCLYNVLHLWLTTRSPCKGQRLIRGTASKWGVRNTRVRSQLQVREEGIGEEAVPGSVFS